MARQSNKNPLTQFFTETKARVVTVGGTVGLFWVIELVDNLILSGRLDHYGVHPHELRGLLGILFAPFLHANFGHLIANTLGFFILGLLVTSRKLSDYWTVFWGSAVAAGLGCWAFGGLGGANEVHIGASGVIFGFLGFLMARGWFERKFGSIALSIVVTYFFHEMLFGVVPESGSNISWQAHLFGLLGGVGMAWLMTRFQQGKKSRR